MLQPAQQAEMRQMVDHLVDFYKLDLMPRGIAQKVWFDHGLHPEIIIDFLRFFNVPANVRLIKTSTKTAANPHGLANIAIPEPCPHHTSIAFRLYRFEVRVDPDCYRRYEQFACVLTHELAHLVLHSTHNKFRHSEVATDIMVILYGLDKEFVARAPVSWRPSSPEYINQDQVNFVIGYLQTLRMKRPQTARPETKAPPRKEAQKSLFDMFDDLFGDFKKDWFK